MTNGPPPPPIVTGLQASSTGPLCPNETVEFKATTSPPDVTVTWKVAVNGGEPEVVIGNGNTLEISGGGETKETVSVQSKVFRLALHSRPKRVYRYLGRAPSAQSDRTR
jgi:hypothetical protein